MNKKIYSGTGLVLLAVAFLVFTLFNNMLFTGVKLDLTQGHLYTLSPGTKKIIAKIDEPINLYFFFSNKASENLAGLRAYSQRVKELLEQYQSLSNGKIKLHVIDPEPFSKAEDKATGFGLQGVPDGNDNTIYFGLAGTNSVGDHQVIPFFAPGKERFLEYKISRLIQSLEVHKKPVVGLMSSLKMDGGIDMKTFHTSPPWVVMTELHKEFDVRNIKMTATSIPKDVKLLMIVHPKNLSEETRFAIDQFAMRGGHVLVFVDPLAEKDTPKPNGMLPNHHGDQASHMNGILESWGVKLRNGVIVADAKDALQVRGQSGQAVRHLAILGLDQSNFNHNDVVTSSLKNINVSTAGILKVLKNATTHVEPLIQSSTYAMAMPTPPLEMLSNPQELEKGFKPTGKKYLIAARITGTASTAFPKGIKGHEKDVVKKTKDLNVIVVADTDMLSDRLWVQVQNFFGRRIASPFANNGDFVVNCVDNLLGSSDLISIRSRGRYTRPFVVVQNLRRKAEARYQQSANDLQAQLSETEQKLQELEKQKTKHNLLTLSPGQQAALEKFRKEKLHIRKQLREVRHQLDKNIESLGTTLKFLNIIFFPLVLTLLLLLGHTIFNHRRGTRR